MGLWQVQTKKESIAATGHSWGAPVYTWSKDNSTVTATRTCGACGLAETETVNTTSEITKPAACEARGNLWWHYEGRGYEDLRFCS